VEQANNGVEALAMSKSMEYDIIFIDHIMPDMNGIETTAAIRKILPDEQKTVIIAFTADASESVISSYSMIGANDVYAKPIGLLELELLLKKWCPKAKFEKILVKEDETSNNIYENIKTIVESIHEIDYSAGLRYAMGNPVQYMKILVASMKDLKSCINIIINSHENNTVKKMQLGVHKLKNIFSDIGAVALYEETIFFEKIIVKNDKIQIDLLYDGFLKNLEQFEETLHFSLAKYFVCTQLEDNEPDHTPMNEEEYEQCLIKTIYYIKRYEFDSIVKEMQHLILHGNMNLRQEYENAFKEIMDYEYEAALARMIKIKNETGNSPVPEFNKMIQLEDSWDWV
jgi:CheY-like chemotaxis protein